MERRVTNSWRQPLSQPRVFEVNLRFDTSTGELGRGCRAVLRLRQDKRVARLTYKGPGQAVWEGARLRQEIEFKVSDFAVCTRLPGGSRLPGGHDLRKKYRGAYDLDGAEVSLDELPYGCFLSRSKDPTRLACSAWRKPSRSTGRSAAPESYTALFEKLRTRLSFTFRDLSFDNFATLPVTAADLGLRAADEG